MDNQKFEVVDNGDGTVTVRGEAGAAPGGATVRVTNETTDEGYAAEACDEDGLPQIDEHLQRVFTDGTLTFEIQAARLTIMRGDIGVMATTDN